MSDFRKVEAELVHLLDAAGVDVVRESGDVYAVVLSNRECGRPSLCECVVNLQGRLECLRCDIEEGGLNGKWATIRITEIAKRLAGT
ncbi:MAG: hypothetical protein V4773_11975 [Verrucomicrobiota bacterium]